MKRKGFTLVELLVVIIIIGILAGIAMPQYNKMVEKARAIEAIVAFGYIRTAQFLYYFEHGVFANTSDAPFQVGVWNYPGEPLSTEYTGRTNYLLGIKVAEKSFKNFYVEAYPKGDLLPVVRKYSGGFKVGCKKAKDTFLGYVFGMDHDGNILGQPDLQSLTPFSDASGKDYKAQTGL